MGQRGPLPKNFFEPKPVVMTDTSVPPDLDDLATAEWTRIVTELLALGRVCNLDRALLTIYCQSHSDYQRYGQAIRDQGETYVTPSGQRKVMPEVTMRKQAAAQMLQAAVELGFTPNSRARMKLPTEQSEKRSLSEEIARAKAERHAEG